MKLVVLLYGQRALQGQTVNFPVNTSEVCSSFPKTLDNAGIVLIAPPRSGSSDTTETPVPQTYFSIWRPCTVRALYWLREHNMLYRDVEIEEVSDDSPSSQTAKYMWGCGRMVGEVRVSSTELIYVALHIGFADMCFDLSHLIAIIKSITNIS